MKNSIFFLIPLLALQISCGQGIQTKFSSGNNGSLTCTNCNAPDTTQLDSKISETEAALKAADSEVTAIEPGRIILDPSKLLKSGSLRKFVEKVRELISKLEELEKKIDEQLALLDPVLNADLIAKLQKIKERLARVESDIFSARDRLVAKIDVVIQKIEAAIDKLNPLVRLALSSKIEKLMDKLYSFRNELASIT